MPKYQKAKPFDFVQDFLNLQKTVKQLQTRSPGQASPWVDLSGSVLSPFSVPAEGFIQYRTTMENELQVSLSLSMSGATTNLAKVCSDAIPIVPTSAVASGSITTSSKGGHWASIYTDLLQLPTSNSSSCGMTVSSDGFLYIRGFSTNATMVFAEVRFPLNV